MEADTRSGIDPRIATILLGLCMCMSGAAGLVNEYILSTVSTYILGNSIEQFSINIAIMMLFMGIAGVAQRALPDERLLGGFAAIVSLLALCGGFAPIAAYAAFAYAGDHYVLVQYGLAATIGFLIGFEIPLVLRINRAYVPEFKSNLSIILGLDYVGSFAGAVVWAYVLLRLFPLTEISFIVSGANFACALLAIGYFAWHGAFGRPRLVLAASAAVAFALAFGFARNRAWDSALEQRLYDDPIVSAATTKYQRVVVTRNPQTDEHRLYINGNVQFSSVDEARYHELLVHPPMRLAARPPVRVLVLGGGDGMAMREVLKYPSVRSATLVDLDPYMTDLARRDPVLARLNDGALRDARVAVAMPQGVTDDGWGEIWQDEEHEGETEPTPVKVADVTVYNLDADLFIRGVEGATWDIVIVDFPDPNSIELAKLYSREFYRKLQRVLAPGGMIAVQSTSPYHAKPAFLCILRTMRAAGLTALPYHENVPSFGDWGWVLAWHDDRTEEQVRGAIGRLQGFTVPTTYLTADVLRRSLTFGKGELAEAADAPVNTLMNPVLHDDYVRLSWLVE